MAGPISFWVALWMTRRIAIDFLKAEEDALSDEQLPVTRRLQIIRYFKALREQLGDSNEKEE